MDRKILRVANDLFEVAPEALFESEAKLHRAIAAHPEVLPNEDLRLGPLVALAEELDLGAGPMDLLAADPQGRLVIIEFKKGTENTDVRKVVAQLLDYGSVLWGRSYDELEEACRSRDRGKSRDAPTMESRISQASTDVDPEAFRAGVSRSLEAGDFVFLYVVRDLDSRTKRIIAYLSEGAQMSFFAVEVDHFRFPDESAVLVPRTAYVPARVAESGPGRARGVGRPYEDLLDEAGPKARELARRMDEFAEREGWTVTMAVSARAYRPTPGGPSFLFYPHWGMEIPIRNLRRFGLDAEANRCLSLLVGITQREISERLPKIDPNDLLENWDRVEKELLLPMASAFRRVSQADKE